MLRRIGLFLLTNLLIIVTISIVFRIIGLDSFITANGIDFGSLLVFSAIIGFVGAFISLAMSKWMAKMAMRIKVLNPRDPGLSLEEKRLVDRVHALAQQAGLKKMPEVGIYSSGEVNAFATGPSRNNSLVAVSTGLLASMDDDAVEGVLAHEVAHVANGDMVTMTLLQGIINTFVIFLSRVVAFAVSRFVREEMSTMVYFICTIVFDILFSILGSLVVFAFSRYREYRADGAGAALAGRQKMIHALQSLKRRHEYVDNSQATVAAFKINGKGNWLRLFSTHPDLDDRIRRLQEDVIKS